MKSRWRWLRSLRFRITAIATVAFAVVLLLVGVFVARAQSQRLLDTIDDTLDQTSAEVDVALDLVARSQPPTAAACSALASSSMSSSTDARSAAAVLAGTLGLVDSEA